MRGRPRRRFLQPVGTWQYPCRALGGSEQSLLVHVDNMTKEGVSVLLNEVTDVGKATTADNVSVLEFIESVHNNSTSLIVHVESLPVVQVRFNRGPYFVRGCDPR